MTEPERDFLLIWLQSQWCETRGLVRLTRKWDSRFQVAFLEELLGLLERFDRRLCQERITEVVKPVAPVGLWAVAVAGPHVAASVSSGPSVPQVRTAISGLGAPRAVGVVKPQTGPDPVRGVFLSGTSEKKKQ